MNGIEDDIEPDLLPALLQGKVVLVKRKGSSLIPAGKIPPGKDDEPGALFLPVKVFNYLLTAPDRDIVFAGIPAGYYCHIQHNL